MFPAQKGDARTEPLQYGLWVVAVARTRILAAKSRDITAEIDRFIDPA
jgi:hypothetical protein